jgi:hypothetical protein
MTLTKALIVATALVAGCGGSIEDQVRSEYADHAAANGFGERAQNVDRVECTDEPTRNFDGWCRIHPKNFDLSYDVPYRGD